MNNRDLYDTPPAGTRTLPPASPDNLERGRLRLILTTIAINILVVALLTSAPWSDGRTAVGLNLIDNTMILGWILICRDRLIARLVLFGVVVGFCELVADAWLVDVTRTLDYSPAGSPMLWRSPAWMPFAWEVVTVQFGYLGLRLWERHHYAGLLLVGVLGAINIPYYEEMARLIHWWVYSNCRMLSHTPYYIIVGEFGIAMALGCLAIPLRHGGGRLAIVLGMAGGVAIFVCYGLAYTVIDGV
jgi:hypothetical protein